MERAELMEDDWVVCFAKADLALCMC